MSTYTQLTRAQRYRISALMKAGHTQRETADTVGVHKSTITRELHRNRGNKGYRPRQAHKLASERQLTKVVSTRIPRETWNLIERLLDKIPPLRGNAGTIFGLSTMTGELMGLGPYPFPPRLRHNSRLMVDLCTPGVLAISVWVWVWTAFFRIYIRCRCSRVSCVYLLIGASHSSRNERLPC